MRTISYSPLHFLILPALLALTPACSTSIDTGATGGEESGEESGWGTDGGSSATAGVTAGASDSAGDSTGATSMGSGTTGGDESTTGEATTGADTDSTTGDTDTDTDTDTTGGEELCDVDLPVTLFLSPDDSNSMSSPVQVREAILGGWQGYLGAVPIRMWEFFNYYTFVYPEAKPGEVVVTPELFRLEEQPEGEYLLQIGVSSANLSNAERPPMNITLVLDESGSMSGPPMDMLKESCRALAASLKAGDVVSMVGWDVENAIKLSGYKVSGPSDPTLMAKIEALAPGGGTNLNGGLVAGYELAQASFDPQRINRVVLISDGGANAGITDIDIIGGGAGSNDEDGIYLVGVGVGSYDSYHDGLMNHVTDAGKGASVFIPTKEEAWKIFGDDFVNTMAVAARDVQVRLEMPPGFEIVKFSGEEYSADPSEIEPQHLAPNDAMVFHQTIRTCAPELVDDATPITVTARYKDAITFEQREVSATITFGELLGNQSPMVRKGAALYAYVEALQAVQAGDESAAAIAEAGARIDAAQALLPGDADLAEIEEILAAIE